MGKISWTRDGFTWFISIDLWTIKKGVITKLNGTNSIIRGDNNASPNSLIDIHHQCEELDQPICGVEDKRIHKNVPVLFRGMIFVNVGDYLHPRSETSY